MGFLKQTLVASGDDGFVSELIYKALVVPMGERIDNQETICSWRVNLLYRHQSQGRTHRFGRNGR